MSKKQQNMVVPVWQTQAAICTVAVIAVLVGISILAQGAKGLPKPAYAVMDQAAAWYVWGTFFTVPGVASLGLIFSRFRKYARGWLLWLSGLYLFVGVSLVPFVISHGFLGLLSVLLFLAFSVHSFLAALKATLLP